MIIAGVVLAGGRSRRFGRDKARELLGGRPLIAWTLGALGPASSRLAVNGPADLAAALDLPCVTDIVPGQTGALAGIAAALAWASSEDCSHCLTAPCDTPFLPPDLGPRLAMAIGGKPVVAARARRRHPLCGLWRTDMAGPLADLARRPDYPSLQQMVDDLGGGWQDFGAEAEETFANLNTPEEFAAAASRLEGHGSR